MEIGVADFPGWFVQSPLSGVGVVLAGGAFPQPPGIPGTCTRHCCTKSEVEGTSQYMVLVLLPGTYTAVLF